MRFKAFRAWRPDPAVVAKVASPPYDVVNRAEAAAIGANNPLSFLHIGRADIDLPATVDPYDERVYRRAAQNLKDFISQRVLIQEAGPSIYIYELMMDGRSQVGVVGCVHIDDYANDVIKKHEKTRPDKEDDRTRHVLALNANAEPVFLTYRPRPFIDKAAIAITEMPPLYDFVAEDGVTHRVWRAKDPGFFIDGFRRVDYAYVADGHHRCASAWRAGKDRRVANPVHRGDEEYNWFLAAMFPSNQLRILPYNRVIRDLNGQTVDQVLDRLKGVGTLGPTDSPKPESAGSFGIYLDGKWYRLTVAPAPIDPKDPIAALEATLLQDRILGPILGIGDQRTDKRIDFVGGIRGTAELERRVDSGEMALGVAMFATTLEQLMAVSDAGQVMPPKCTWFEPKLRSGLFVHALD